MRKCAIFVILVLAWSKAFSQIIPQAKPSSYFINANDTTYLRILNGVIIDNNHIVKEFESVSIKSRQDPANFQKGGRQIMVIGTDISDLESKIDSILYSRPEFLEKYKYPLDLRLPISVNGKLLFQQQRIKALDQLSLEKIKKIEYFDANHRGVDPNVTPYGVINLRTK